MEQPLGREEWGGVPCPWKVGVEMDTGEFDTGTQAIGEVDTEVDCSMGDAWLCSHLGCLPALGLCGFECSGFCGA